MNDAKTIGVAGFRSLWLEAVYKVCDYFDTLFKGGIRQAAMDGVTYMNYFVKTSWDKLKTFFTVVSLAVQGLTSDMDSLKQSLEDVVKAKTVETWSKMKNALIRTADWTGLSEFVLGHKINVTKSTSRERQAVDDAINGLLKNVDFDAIGTVINDSHEYQ